MIWLYTAVHQTATSLAVILEKYDDTGNVLFRKNLGFASFFASCRVFALRKLRHADRFGGIGQLVRRSRNPLVLHLIPSPSGFFVAGLEGGGPRDEKTRWRRCMSARFLSQRGIQSGGGFLCHSMPLAHHNK